MKKTIFALTVVAMATTCFAASGYAPYTNSKTIKKEKAISIKINANVKKIIKSYTISSTTLKKLKKAKTAEAKKTIYVNDIEPSLNTQYNVCCIYLKNKGDANNLRVNYRRYTFPATGSETPYPTTVQITKTLHNDTEGTGPDDLVSGKYGSAFCSSSYAPKNFSPIATHYELRCSTCTTGSKNGQCVLQNKKGSCTISLKNESEKPISIGIYCGEGKKGKDNLYIYKGSQTNVGITQTN